MSGAHPLMFVGKKRTIHDLEQKLKQRKWRSRELAADMGLSLTTIQHYLLEVMAKSETAPTNGDRGRGKPQRRYWLDPDGPEAA